MIKTPKASLSSKRWDFFFERQTGEGSQSYVPPVSSVPNM